MSTSDRLLCVVDIVAVVHNTVLMIPVGLNTIEL